MYRQEDIAKIPIASAAISLTFHSTFPQTIGKVAVFMHPYHLNILSNVWSSLILTLKNGTSLFYMHFFIVKLHIFSHIWSHWYVFHYEKSIGNPFFTCFSHFSTSLLVSFLVICQNSLCNKKISLLSNPLVNSVPFSYLCFFVSLKKNLFT